MICIYPIKMNFRVYINQWIEMRCDNELSYFNGTLRACSGVPGSNYKVLFTV